MKKISLLGLCIFLASVTFAQLTPVEFGLKGGINRSALRAEASTNKDSGTGWHAGALAHLHLSRAFALQPEVTFSVQGAQYDNNRKNKLRYVNIPVLGQFMFGNGFRVQTGPQLGILTSAASERGHFDTDIEKDFRKTDLSWSLGAGYLSRSGLGLDIRYNHGLRDISQATPDLRNRVWQLGLFYQFRL